MIYRKEIEIRYSTDVFIAGGGPAGVAAALACRKCGKSVFLAESQGFFGGAASASLVPCFAAFGDGVNLLASGVGLDIRKNVSRDVPLDAKWTPIKVEELKREYDRAMEQSGADYTFFTTVCDVIAKDGVVDCVVLSSKSGLFGVKASVYIDCTGDGDLCALAGADFELGDINGNVMPGTLCSLWANIDFSRRSSVDSARLESAFEDGVFTRPDRHLPGMQTVDSEHGIGGGNIGHTFGYDPLDERSLTSAVTEARATLAEYEKYYKEYLTGFEDMVLVGTGAALGVRESRRIVCDYTLSVDDFIARACFEDEIGRYCYPVDIHIMNTDKEEFERFSRDYNSRLRYGKGESYGIPYRSLVPKGFDNLLVAGRCIGTDREMQASVRVMPGCFITGQAAGVAAALAADAGKTRAVDISQLRRRLREIGAYLPEHNSECQ